MKKHAVSRLVVTPPGLRWPRKGGQLTKTVRRCPYSVALFGNIG